MKRALVLSGGGSRGAYEIGAWQALAELGVRLHAVYGTSIGAINAALVAQGDLDLAKELWAHITVRQIVATDEEDFSIDRMVSRKRPHALGGNFVLRGERAVEIGDQFARAHPRRHADAALVHPLDRPPAARRADRTGR